MDMMAIKLAKSNVPEPEIINVYLAQVSNINQ